MTASTNNRDLDRAVAEALGWKNVRDTQHPSFGWIGDPPDDTLDAKSLPHYSTDIRAAFEALEEFCKARGYGWAVDRKLPSESVIAFIFKFDDKTNAWCGEGEIATAICRAIVAAAQEKPTSA